MSTKLYRPLAIFFLFSLMFFARSYRSYFVSDDYAFLGRITLAGAGQYFTKSWGYGNEYRPLVAYSYALNAETSGSNPIGYHLTNILLHSSVAVLVGAIAYQCGVSPIASGLAAFIFLLNPVSHESFLWIAGRPVIQSALFLFSSLLSFLKCAESETKKRRCFSSTLAYLTFIAGLFSYEGVVILPLLACAMYFFFPRYRSKTARIHLIGLSVVGLAYIGLWNWLFRFQITRFPVETSVLGASFYLWEAILYALHGSRRLLIGSAYLGLLCTLLKSHTRRLGAFCAVWFVVAYLPFLLVKGFADRFAYVASAAVAIGLAVGLTELWQRTRLGGAIACSMLVAFYSIGMQNRITVWNTAGEIAHTITRDIKAARPTLPQGTTLVLLRAPDMYKHATVFLTGLDQAVKLQYPPGAVFWVKRAIDPDLSPPVITFEYRDGRMRELPGAHL